jgi:hypothetical protein
MRSIPSRRSFSKIVHHMTLAEQFESAKAQRSQQASPIVKPRKHDAPLHLICNDCGAEGHSTSLAHNVLLWVFPGSLSRAMDSLKSKGEFPYECFYRSVGCGKCGSHRLEGICVPCYSIFH